jgi:hypothetical protein
MNTAFYAAVAGILLTIYIMRRRTRLGKRKGSFGSF